MVNMENLIEIRLKKSDDFLKIKETLSRIGVASEKNKILYQSCHILHKKGRFFIVHFKEMFMLDGKPTDFTEEDKARRNTIANLLEEWDLLELIDPSKSKTPVLKTNMIKILPFNKKDEWKTVVKYTMASDKRKNKEWKD